MIALLFCCGALYGEEVEESESFSKWQAAYLMQRGECRKAIDAYMSFLNDKNAHDFELLHQLGVILLEHGARDEHVEKQLVSMFGAHLAGIHPSIDLLELGIKSRSPETQIASLQTLANMQDDRCDEFLLKAMASEFLPVRLEAGFYLALRKHPSSVGQIEALMYRIPPFFRFIFPEFFALIGTKDAISVLRSLMSDENMHCRVEAILSAARYGRDDLLSAVRMRASHLNSAEQEACAAALGILRDSHSFPRLQKLAQSPSPCVQLAALYSLISLGDEEAKERVVQCAKEQDPFAIALAGELVIGQEELGKLVSNTDLQVRINASIALLKARDRRSLPGVLEILLRDTRDLGIIPLYSPGRSLSAWKIIPSLSQRQQVERADFLAVSLAVREMLLRDCLELPEKDFLELARVLFFRKQMDLVPLLISLIENLHSKEAIQLLQQQANTAGAPLIRTYCALSLFRQNIAGNYEELLQQWLAGHKQTDMLQFRRMLPFHLRPTSSPYELTAEETSRLLIEIYQAFADRHTKQGIDLILDAIREGHAQNRYALAGLLLRTLQ